MKTNRVRAALLCLALVLPATPAMAVLDPIPGVDVIVKKNPGGKLRLLYEANPLAFIAEQAGGHAVSGKTRIMDIEPQAIHQRTPLIIGSRTEVAEFQETHGADPATHSFAETARSESPIR